MSRLIVSIELENDAFADGRADREVARILRELSERILRELSERIAGWTLPAEIPAAGYDLGPLFDINGNAVGRAEIV